MAQATANGINIEYEVHGPEKGEPLLLIMGLGAQLTRWSPKMIEGLVGKGYKVIAYDNRDVGLSHKFEEAGPANLADPSKAAYTLDDMADDAAGLLDALGVKKAHVVGASMGGYIAQTLAVRHPQRVVSLVSIMSSTGNPSLPGPTPAAQQALMNRAPNGASLDEIVEVAFKAETAIGSPGYRIPEAELRARIRSDSERSYYPVGVGRQMAAIMASGDRRKALKTIRCPTVVLHGADDPLVPPAGGEDTAANIMGAELRLIPGMGHDFPDALADVFVDAVERAAGRARVAGARGR